MAAHHDVQVERTYLKIFFVLFVLTLFEVGLTYLPFAKWALAIALVSLAFFKAGLVAAFYMHLKFEGKLLYLVCATPVVLVTLLTFGLMPDVGKRVGARTKVDFAPAGAHGQPVPHGSAAPSAPASAAH